MRLTLVYQLQSLWHANPGIGIVLLSMCTSVHVALRSKSLETALPREVVVPSAAEDLARKTGITLLIYSS